MAGQHLPPVLSVTAACAGSGDHAAAGKPSGLVLWGQGQVHHGNRECRQDHSQERLKAAAGRGRGGTGCMQALIIIFYSLKAIQYSSIQLYMYNYTAISAQQRCPIQL